jgi:hypothetical protein
MCSITSITRALAAGKNCHSVPAPESDRLESGDSRLAACPFGRRNSSRFLKHFAQQPRVAYAQLPNHF